MSRDDHVFARGHDLDGELSEEAQPLGYGFADIAAVFTDAAGEGERVDAAERGGHGGDGLRHPVGVDGEAKRIVEAAEGCETRLVFECIVYLG